MVCPQPSSLVCAGCTRVLGELGRVGDQREDSEFFGRKAAVVSSMMSTSAPHHRAMSAVT